VLLKGNRDRLRKHCGKQGQSYTSGLLLEVAAPSPSPLYIII
jgi:hypothetical protein